jgi:hypothetical protein
MLAAPTLLELCRHDCVAQNAAAEFLHAGFVLLLWQVCPHKCLQTIHLGHQAPSEQRNHVAITMWSLDN